MEEAVDADSNVAVDDGVEAVDADSNVADDDGVEGVGGKTGVMGDGESMTSEITDDKLRRSSSSIEMVAAFFLENGLAVKGLADSGNGLAVKL